MDLHISIFSNLVQVGKDGKTKKENQIRFSFFIILFLIFNLHIFLNNMEFL